MTNEVQAHLKKLVRELSFSAASGVAGKTGAHTMRKTFADRVYKALEGISSRRPPPSGTATSTARFLTSASRKKELTT